MKSLIKRILKNSQITIIKYKKTNFKTFNTLILNFNHRIPTYLHNIKINGLILLII